MSVMAALAIVPRTNAQQRKRKFGGVVFFSFIKDDLKIVCIVCKLVHIGMKELMQVNSYADMHTIVLL